MKEEYTGVFFNYRRGPKTQKSNEGLIKIIDLDSDETGLIGWKVGWPEDSPKLKGIILKPHGKSGTFRVKFQKGLPGQALGTRLKIVKEWKE